MISVERKEQLTFFVNSTEFWSNVLPYSDTDTLKNLSRLNHRLHSAVLSQRFTPYYTTTINILVTYVSRNCSETPFPVPCEKLFGLDRITDVNNRVIESFEKIVNFYNEENEQRRITMRLFYEFNQKQQNLTTTVLPPPPLSLPAHLWDGVIVITERSYVNMRSLLCKKLGIFSEGEEEIRLPIVVINKDNGCEFGSGSSSQNMDIKSLKVIEGKTADGVKEQCIDDETKDIENDVVKFFAEKCTLTKYSDQLKSFHGNVSGLFNLSQPEYFNLVDSNSFVDRTLGSKCDRFLRAISFTQFEPQIQQRVLCQFFAHYVGYLVRDNLCVRMTGDAHEECDKIGYDTFMELSDLIARKNGEIYCPVVVDYDSATSNFIVRYWQAELDIDETNCKRVIVTIPSTNQHQHQTHLMGGIQVSTERMSKQVHYGRKFVGSIQNCIDFWVTTIKEEYADV